jgi:uncharacterized protein (TIGR03089 family)
VRGLSDLTAGLAGPRDPAAPLLTLLDGPARVELSGSTVANWVAKDANLLVDGYGSPARIGLLLPLHWQAVALLLAAVATGAVAVVADGADGLAGCDLGFTTTDRAEAVLDAGVDDVLAVSTHPLGLPVAGLPAMVGDHAREAPGHGDHFSGPRPGAWHVERDGCPVRPLAGLGPQDRLLTVQPFAAGLPALLGALAAGAAVVLAPGGDAGLAERVAAEQVTATAGLDLPGLPRLA